jgi:HK97 family phage prohead protease
VPDDQGLFIQANLAKTTAGKDLYELIKRGDIDKMSFAFTVGEDAYDKKTRTRKIRGIKKLWDVAAVETPAYDTTSISARSFFEVEAEKERKASEDAQLRRKLLLKTYF